MKSLKQVDYVNVTKSVIVSNLSASGAKRVMTLRYTAL
jgi:hypothetical protein